MNKHLQQRQFFDSFYNEENYPHLSGDEPCLDPDCMDEEQIYNNIVDEDFSDYNMNELELDEYEDFMLL